jgi:CRP-like cAMP-binding protein
VPQEKPELIRSFPVHWRACLYVNIRLVFLHTLMCCFQGTIPMLDQWLVSMPRLEKRWARYKPLFTEVHVPAKCTLLKEGEVPRKIFFIKKGCLRASFNNRGKDITFQFFFEGDAVASIEGFRANQPSPISIKSVEASTLIVLHKNGFETLMHDFPEIKDLLLDLAFRRFAQYSQLFLSYLKHTPRQRYEKLLEERPDIIKRVPQHYIASYLGITPVSLSRIRKRI